MASAVLLAIFRLHNTAMAPLHRCAAPRSYATYLLLGRTPRAARLAGRCSFLLMPRERDGQCGVAGDVRTSQRVDGAPLHRCALTPPALLVTCQVGQVLGKRGSLRNSIGIRSSLGSDGAKSGCPVFIRPRARVEKYNGGLELPMGWSCSQRPARWPICVRRASKGGRRCRLEKSFPPAPPCFRRWGCFVVTLVRVGRRPTMVKAESSCGMTIKRAIL